MDGREGKMSEDGKWEITKAGFQYFITFLATTLNQFAEKSTIRNI